MNHVEDNTGYTSNYTEDIDNQSSNNYTYDAIGNLISDDAEGIDLIEWTVYGKIAHILKGSDHIYYTYDAAGNRISKVANGKTTIYVRDGSGNVMSIYEAEGEGDPVKTEDHIYGSRRIGIVNRLTVAPVDVPLSESSDLTIMLSTFTRGEKNYELSNHLGNVLVTITDKKIRYSSSIDDYYGADVVSAVDYFPFGMTMPGRSYSVDGYRYGFNGKENDNDISEGKQDYGLRIYDNRIGRFLSVDPLESDYPWNSTYCFAEGDPINYVDLDGAEKEKSDIQIPDIQKQNSPRLDQLRHNAYLLETSMVGASNATINSLSLGLTDAFPSWMDVSTDNLSYHNDTEEEAEAYLRGRIAGDVAVMIPAAAEVDGGLTAAGGGASTVVISVGGLLVAGHGALVARCAYRDIQWCLRKLNQLGIVYSSSSDVSNSTNEQATSAQNKNPGASNSNTATGTGSKVQNNGRINTKKPVLEAGRHDKVWDGKKNSKYNQTRGGTDAPSNVKELFKNSVPDVQGKNWYSKDRKGIIHRFSGDTNGKVHWNGSTGAGNPIQVPIEVKRRLFKKK